MNEKRKRAFKCLADFFELGERGLFVLEEMARRNSFTRREAVDIYFKKFYSLEKPGFFTGAFNLFNRHDLLKEESRGDLRSFFYIPNEKLKRFHELVSRFLDDVSELLDGEDSA